MTCFFLCTRLCATHFLLLLFALQNASSFLFFTPILLLCYFPVATGTDVGWFYLFPFFLCHLGGVQLFSIILFHLFSTHLAPKLRMIKALVVQSPFGQIVLEVSL